MESSRKFGIIVFTICCCTAALGLGLSVGYSVMGHLIPEPPAVEREVVPPTIASVRLTPLAVPISAGTQSFVDIIPQVKDAVVSISVTTIINRPTGRIETPGAGSGFIFARDDTHVFIATNNHVVENAHSISISLDDNENFPAAIVGYDAAADLAVLVVCRVELEASGVPYSVASFGDSSVMRMGDGVVAIGNAMGEGQVVTKGIVSATNLTIVIDDISRRIPLELDVMQTDAAVNRGNSGGPLINQYGEVIGIVVAKILGADVEGMGYALPSNNIVDIIMDIKAKGVVYTPHLGIIYEAVSDATGRLFNLPSAGILVIEVPEGTAAHNAGILPNDLIVSLGGRRIADGSDYADALGAHAPDDIVDIGIYRRGVRLYITVTLGRILR